MNMKCLVTGGAGFIGCAISPLLAHHFDEVVAVDNLHPQVHASRLRPVALDSRIKLIEADVTELATWDVIFPDFQPDVVIHLAAETGTGQSLTESTRHASTNIVGLTQMLDALCRYKHMPLRIVLASSRAVYGEGSWASRSTGWPIYPGSRTLEMLGNQTWAFPGFDPVASEAETTVAKPISVYGATKYAQEQILSSWCNSMGVGHRILRLQNVYGPGQSLTNSYTGIVALFARLASEGRTIDVYEDGNIVRDFVFIQDVATAILQVCILPTVSSLPYDVGSGVATSILELANLIASRYGAPRPEISGRYRLGDVRFAACQIERTKHDLSWEPCWRLASGVDALCEWIKLQDR